MALLAAEKRLATSAEILVLRLVVAGDWDRGNAQAVLDALQADATAADVTGALHVAARLRVDITGPHRHDTELDIATGLLRTTVGLAETWWDVCQAVDEWVDLDEAGLAAVDRWADGPVTDRVGWRADRLAALNERIDEIAWKAVGG